MVQPPDRTTPSRGSRSAEVAEAICKRNAAAVAAGLTTCKACGVVVQPNKNGSYARELILHGLGHRIEEMANGNTELDR